MLIVIVVIKEKVFWMRKMVKGELIKIEIRMGICQGLNKIFMHGVWKKKL